MLEVIWALCMYSGTLIVHINLFIALHQFYNALKWWTSGTSYEWLDISVHTRTGHQYQIRVCDDHFDCFCLVSWTKKSSGARSGQIPIAQNADAMVFFDMMAFLNAFLTVWGRKSRRTEILSAKEPRSWEVNCSSNSELTTMNSTSSSSGPLFVTLTVSHSWHRNNPPALCWWEQNRIFVGALWGSTLDEAMF